ncbi:hypothetical protein [Nocardia terpenica]|uniref:hypothetical protein n=1 Tax=Nocardia terpenica TaxID=455432 RepID=UPI0012E8935E|nr:hypothetical protein [Nocardia terpenica]NQE86243.1 hypothetical protein [Nocardia terpenica]
MNYARSAYDAEKVGAMSAAPETVPNLTSETPIAQPVGRVAAAGHAGIAKVGRTWYSFPGHLFGASMKTRGNGV